MEPNQTQNVEMYTRPPYLHPVFIALFLLVTTFGMVGWYLVPQIRLEQAKVSTDETQNWKTYRNEEYGFEFNYPNNKNINIYKDNYEGPLTPFGAPPVVYLKIRDFESQTDGVLTFSVNKNPSTSSVCSGNLDQAKDGYSGILKLQSKTEVVINGVLFKRSDYKGDELTGLERDYSVVRGESCYVLQLTTFANSCVSLGCEDKRWSYKTEQLIQDQLDAVIKSFKFTK